MRRGSVSASTRGLVLAGAAILASAASEGAGGQFIHQSGRMFSETAIQLRRGEPVTFVNDDRVPHNVMSLSPDNAFDIGSQPPGTTRTVRFDVAGVVAVICAIHPRMHMVVTVVE